MRRIIPMALIVAASCVAADLGGPLSAPRADARLEGTWVIESVQKDGKPDATQVGGTVTFAGGSVTFQPPKTANGWVVVRAAPPAATQRNAAFLS